MFKVDEDKTKVIKEWPIPKCAIDVRSFHGLASFYRRFVKDFRKLAVLLREVIKSIRYLIGENDKSMHLMF